MMGTHDFWSFCGALDRSTDSTVRNISKIDILIIGEKIEIEVEGNAFLPHQVRRMVGALVDLGRERLVLKDIQEMLVGEGEARSNSIPAKGLCLEKIIYEKELDLAPVN
jgi:tRNA pseudouridine38-40 synthase